jgi:uncharacterized membrane protein
MLKLFYAVLTGLVGAGIVHIVVLLLLPQLTERDAWSRLERAGALYAAVPADGSDGRPAIVEVPDPFFRAVACRFDLEGGPLRVTAQGNVPFWSASIYNRSGDNIYNFNDRTAADGALDFVVVTPVQMIELRKELPPELESAIFVEADVGEGIVVVRAFQPDESWRAILSAFTGSVACATQD